MEFGHTPWRKSSFSSETEACVEIAYSDWRKASLSSETADCVEIAYPVEVPAVGIRDSKNPAGGVLLAGSPAWKAFRLAAKGAALDLP